MVIRQGDIEGHPMQADWNQISENEQAIHAHGAFDEVAYWAAEEREREQALKIRELERELDSE